MAGQYDFEASRSNMTRATLLVATAILTMLSNQALRAQQTPMVVTQLLTPITGPRIASVTSDEGAVFSNPRLLDPNMATIRLVNLPAGAKVQLTGGMLVTSEQAAALRATNGTANCVSRYNSAEPAGTVAADGSLTVRGLISNYARDGAPAPAATGPCQLVVGAIITTTTTPKLPERPSSMAKPTQQSAFSIFVSPPFPLKPWTVYRYENTWALRNIFAFQMNAEGLSSCSGTSLGLTTYPIGPINRNGDLAIQIRSGPLGTTCRAVSPGIVVPDTLRLIAIDWAIERDGDKCLAADDAAPKVGEFGVFAPGHIPYESPTTYMGIPQPTFGSTFHAPQPTPGTNQQLLGMAHAWLWCDKALGNDHGVRIVLRSATFEGPANAAAMP